MRRLIIVVSAAVFASFLISFAALSAGAQTDTSDPSATEETQPPEGSTPPEEASDGSEPSEPYHQVVDNATEGRFEASGWRQGAANDATFGQDYAYADPSDDAGPASYKVDIPQTDHYAVFARWPGGGDVTTAASFGVETASGLAWDEVDQRSDAGLWVMIGAYEMEQGERTIQIARSPSGDGRLVADAVMVVGDALVGPDGRVASTANPEELAGETAGAERISAHGGGGRPNGRDVVRKARNYLGVNYKWGTCDPMRVMSCTCLTKKTYAKFRVKLPMTEKGQWRAEPSRKISRSKLKPGDEVFFKESGRSGPITHVGIYAGNGSLVHASSWCGDVCIGKMKYLNGYSGAKRFRLR
jgi:cell wall-associated NlpC family hydrolase